jgi:pimeloyl-ACP methyl ester carboxylesterase
MPTVFKDDLFEAQWLRAVGHSIYGGAEIGECLAVARKIVELDAESWFAAWHTMAERIWTEAEQSRVAGHMISAKCAYLRASNYFRAAYTFMLQAPVDPRLREAYRRQRMAFQAAMDLIAPRVERLAIPYEGTTLPGYFFHAGEDGRRRPTVIINGGYDSSAEECYFFSAAAAVMRGYNAVTFDGPGQGGTIIEQGTVFRPDWEAVVRKVVDRIETMPVVDPAKIALLGISFGGYLAPRAASGEPRIAALIADPGELSLFEEMKSRMPGFAVRALKNDKGFVLGLIKQSLKKRLHHLTGGWGLRRGLFVHGVADPLAYLRLTEHYTVEGRVAQIKCPALICSAENDEIGVTAPRLFDALTGKKTFIAFKADEGAGAHCESGARSLFNQRAFDWLDEVFSH